MTWKCSVGMCVLVCLLALRAIASRSTAAELRLSSKIEVLFPELSFCTLPHGVKACSHKRTVKSWAIGTRPQCVGVCTWCNHSNAASTNPIPSQKPSVMAFYRTQGNDEPSSRYPAAIRLTHGTAWLPLQLDKRLAAKRSRLLLASY